MPRIYSSCSEPIDFCNDCYPTEDEAQEEYGLDVVGEGPDGRGDCFDYDADHPDYWDTDYTCETCGKALESIDD